MSDRDDGYQDEYRSVDEIAEFHKQIVGEAIAGIDPEMIVTAIKDHLGPLFAGEGAVESFDALLITPPAAPPGDPNLN